MLARELNVPGLAAAQLSRAVEQRADKRPVLSDLRESGCLAGDTQVTLSTGELVPIVSLVGKTPEVFAMNQYGKMVPARASKVWLTGHKPVFCLTTASGRTVRATSNHPFWTLTGWEPLSNLQPGDRIAIPRNYPGAEKPLALYEPCRSLFPHHTNKGTPVQQYGLYFSGFYARIESVEKQWERSYQPVRSEPLLAGGIESDIDWDDITCIEPCGQADVYDMTVPEAHSFVANGLIVHNSLEQDSDIVMFIHRPDALEKDSPKQNLAEIIVAKHRNGPTHPGIELIFLSNLARFENAAPPAGNR